MVCFPSAVIKFLIFIMHFRADENGADGLKFAKMPILAHTTIKVVILSKSDVVVTTRLNNILFSKGIIF